MRSTTIELAPHQREAVDRALVMLERRGGVILADDVGLGKSYVAATVAAAVRSKVEFIVPAGLVAQWKRTLDDFGVVARVTTHDRIVGERFVPNAEDDRLIVVDEAHAFRNPHAQRYGALARRSVAAKLMLVTATPICNAPEDLAALVSLIATDDSLRMQGVPSIDAAFRDRDAGEIAVVNRELVIRRGHEVLLDSLRFGELHREIVWHDLPDASIDELRFPLNGGHQTLLHNVLWRRLESSEAALLESIRRQKRFYQRALDCLASGRTLTRRDYRTAFGDEDGDAFQEVLFWEVFATDEIRVAAAEVEEEIERLERLRVEIERAPRSKQSLLANACEATDEPILIFTSAIATANEIFASIGRIRKAGVLTSHRALPADAIEAFRRGGIDVLVCTDLAAEGLNLQRAGVVVHYDLPWNPVRLDQRNGRALRIGQTRATVRAIYFLPLRQGRRTPVVATLAFKNRSRRRLLGGSTLLPAQPNHAASRLALPQRLGRSSPAVALMTALRRRGLDLPPDIARRHRAGIERLLGEMSREYLDDARVTDLISLLRRERIIAIGDTRGSVDCR